VKKYERLYDRYRDLISNGTYPPGERLPSLRNVAAAEGIGLNTARAAFELLERDGLVRARERGGYYARGYAAGGLSPGYRSPAACHLVAGLSASQKIEYLLAREGSATGFALAEPDASLLPAARLERLFVSLSGSWISYGDREGEDELKRRIAAFYHPCHGALTSEDILVTNGATEAIGIALRALVKPGEAVAIESPTYYDYFRQLATVGAKIVEVPVVAGRGMDLDLLAKELGKRRTRMIIAQPNVQNPTGALMPDEDKRRLVELAARAGAILVQDDVYGDLAFSSRRPSNLSAFGDYEGIVYVSSFSKSLAPGLRIGWAHAPAFKSELAAMKGLASLATNHPAQRVLAAYLAGRDFSRHLAGLRAALSRQLAEYLELLSEALPEGSSFLPPAGGCLIWIALPEGFDSSRVFESAAREGIFAAPGELFSANPFFRRHLRINFGHALGERRRAELERLCAIIRGR
jgi:DNA-binding transcriptional MocR family regulator